MRMTLGQLRLLIKEEVSLLRESEDKKSGLLSAIKKFFGGGKSSGGASEKNGLKKIYPNQVMRAISMSLMDRYQSAFREFDLTDDPNEKKQIISDFVSEWASEVTKRVAEEKKRGFTFEPKELETLEEPHWKPVWQSILKGKSPDLKPIVDIFIAELSKSTNTMKSIKTDRDRKADEADSEYRKSGRSQVRSDASGTPRSF